MNTPIGIKPIRKFRVYFRAVSRNTTRRYMKKVIRVQQMEEPWSEAMEGQVQLPDEPLVDERPLILAALAKLSPQYRRILEMIYIEGLSPKSF
jgi:DNA-directed RNA polymerase specialized sigma24 family protein